MATAPPLWRVMCDTNVFYPVSLADLVLSSAEYGLFELAWSLDLLAETERVLVETKGLAPHDARVFVDQIKATFSDGRSTTAST